jgi:hypothetical protein
MYITTRFNDYDKKLGLNPNNWLSHFYASISFFCPNKAYPLTPQNAAFCHSIISYRVRGLVKKNYAQGKIFCFSLPLETFSFLLRRRETLHFLTASTESKPVQRNIKNGKCVKTVMVPDVMFFGVRMGICLCCWYIMSVTIIYESQWIATVRHFDTPKEESCSGSFLFIYLFFFWSATGRYWYR